MKNNPENTNNQDALFFEKKANDAILRGQLDDIAALINPLPAASIERVCLTAVRALKKNNLDIEGVQEIQNDFEEHQSDQVREQMLARAAELANQREKLIEACVLLSFRSEDNGFGVIRKAIFVDKNELMGLFDRLPDSVLTGLIGRIREACGTDFQDALVHPVARELSDAVFVYPNAVQAVLDGAIKDSRKILNEVAGEVAGGTVASAAKRTL